MGSDPQSHLNEQNFLLVGDTKITEADWTNAVRRLTSIREAARKALELPVAGEVKESFVTIDHFASGGLADLTRGVARRYIPELPGEAIPAALPGASIADLLAELDARLFKLGSSLAAETATALKREEHFRSLVLDADTIKKRLAALEGAK